MKISTSLMLPSPIAGHVRAQTREQVSAYLAVAGNDFIRYERLNGGGSSEGKTSVLAGITYGYPLSSRVKLIAGSQSLTRKSAPLPEISWRNVDIHMLSIPCYNRDK